MHRQLLQRETTVVTVTVSRGDRQVEICIVQIQRQCHEHVKRCKIGKLNRLLSAAHFGFSEGRS